VRTGWGYLLLAEFEACGKQVENMIGRQCKRYAAHGSIAVEVDGGEGVGRSHRVTSLANGGCEFPGV
jgi:hypothetical protein